MNPNGLGFRMLLECELGEFSQGEVYLERFLEVKNLSPPGPTPDYATFAAAVPMRGCASIARRESWRLSTV